MTRRRYFGLALFALVACLGALLPLLGYPLGTSTTSNLGKGAVLVTTVDFTPNWYGTTLIALAVVGVLCLFIPLRRRA